MLNLSENYHLRKCFLQRDQVPTQSMMKEKMSPALAAIYFNFMTPRLKELAGLEPSLKGAGNNRFVPPEELLEGRIVLKPIKKEVLSKLNNVGIETIGHSLFQKHLKAMNLEIQQALLDSDNQGRNNVTATTCQLWDDLVAVVTTDNSEQIMKDFNKFVYLYRQSTGKIEMLFHESAVAEIKKTKEEAILGMQNKYAAALELQATTLYDQYEKKLMEKKSKLKIDFMQMLEINRTAMANNIHDLNVDKHTAVEKLRQYLQCQNLACGIYVALKEQEECLKETEESKHKHKKKVKIMADTILIKDFEIHLEEEKKKKRQEFCKIWQKKVCHVVKSFKMFVSYCVNMLPEHAEFFINMEKLMLLQVNEMVEDPSAASIIELEREQFHTPVPRPKPFYLFCDRGYKAKVEQDLCPKHSGTSSASGLPVMIVNKRCLYAACDNFNQFTNKIKEFIHGNRGDDADFKDDLVYEHFIPVKYGSSQRLLEIKLESSLLQVLQQEISNIQSDESKCRECGLLWCSCLPHPTPVDGGEKTKLSSSLITSSRASQHKLQLIGRSMELDHEREPKWDSFCTHVEPKKCSCAKTVKKHLAEHLPVYMRHMKYGPPEIPGYEMCSIKELKALVKEARNEIPPASLPPAVPSRTKDMGTQCNEPEDEILEAMCTCYSDDEFRKFINNVNHTGSPKNNFGAMSPSFMAQSVSSFAAARAHSLRNLVEDHSELLYLNKKAGCDFE